MLNDDYKSKYEILVRLIVEDGGQGVYPCGHLTREQRSAFEGTDAYKCGWNAAIIDGDSRANKLLEQAVDLDDATTMLLSSRHCFWNSDDGTLSLNMNDTWGWALSWCPVVSKDQLEEVARLFRAYGSAGLMYWHSCQEKDMRSEFHDINRKVDFVRNEERILKEIPDSSKRAYHKTSYTLGDK